MLVDIPERSFKKYLDNKILFIYDLHCPTCDVIIQQFFAPNNILDTLLKYLDYKVMLRYSTKENREIIYNQILKRLIALDENIKIGRHKHMSIYLCTVLQYLQVMRKIFDKCKKDNPNNYYFCNPESMERFLDVTDNRV